MVLHFQIACRDNKTSTCNVHQNKRQEHECLRDNCYYVHYSSYHNGLNHRYSCLNLLESTVCCAINKNLINIISASEQMAPGPFNPQLFQMTTRTHASQPCGYVDLKAPCMEQNGAWSICYVKLLSNSTTISVDSIQCMGGDHQQMVHA